MTAPQPTRLFRKKRVRPYVGHGSVYAWLRAYHDEVAGALARQEQSWTTLVADMALDGLTGRRGTSLTANAALRVWQRVCSDVDAEAATEANRRPGDKYPSRISPDWRPQIVPPQAAIASARASAAPSSLPSVSAQGREVVRAPAEAVSDTPDFPTVDPTGAALEPGHVFFQGESMPRRMAEQLAGMLRQAKELDRFN